MPRAGIAIPTSHSQSVTNITTVERLIPLDDVLTNEFYCLLTRRHCGLALGRIEESLRLFDTRIFRDDSTLRRGAEHSDDPVTKNGIDAARLLDHLANLFVPRLNCIAIDNFALGD